MKRQAELTFWLGESRDPQAHDMSRYPRHLMLPADYFAGMRVLDVGCGPIPYAAAFDCEMWGIDPLIDDYQQAGYSLDAMTYVCAPAEAMPFDDDSFDAVISMNALDHVDDFHATAREIQRVSRGIIHVEVHYHPPTQTEPWELSDELMAHAFPTLAKWSETPYSHYYPNTVGSVAVWSTQCRGQ